MMLALEAFGETACHLPPGDFHLNLDDPKGLTMKRSEGIDDETLYFNDFGIVYWDECDGLCRRALLVLS